MQPREISLTKTSTSLIALAAAQIAGLGFTTKMLIAVAPPPTEVPAIVPMADKAILIVGSDDATKYLKVLSVDEDGKNANFAIIDHNVHSLHDLLTLDDHTVIAEAITLEDIKAGGVDGAIQLLFKADDVAKVA